MKRRKDRIPRDWPKDKPFPWSFYSHVDGMQVFVTELPMNHPARTP